MKLINKKTGEIGKILKQLSEDNQLEVITDNKLYVVKSLAELNEEWEDYEEPKDNNYWYIDDFGRTQFSSEVLDEIEEHPNNWMARKLFGNYFETKEEAEKAVEKLKAWKRLRDKGFKFEGWDNTDRSTIHNFSLFVAIEDLESINKDLDLLFGGEE